MSTEGLEWKHPYETTSAPRSAGPHDHSGCQATWREGGLCDTQTSLSVMNTLRQGYPSPKSLLRPLCMNRVWGLARTPGWIRRLDLVMSEGHKRGREGRERGKVQYQEEIIFLRHLVYVQGIPSIWGWVNLHIYILFHYSHQAALDSVKQSSYMCLEHQSETSSS